MSSPAKAAPKPAPEAHGDRDHYRATQSIVFDRDCQEPVQRVCCRAPCILPEFVLAACPRRNGCSCNLGNQFKIAPEQNGPQQRRGLAEELAKGLAKGIARGLAAGLGKGPAGGLAAGLAKEEPED